MIRTLGWTVGALLVASVVGVTAAGGQTSGQLKVTVDYKGAGQVDQTHELFVWAFDTPDITVDSVPIASDVITTNRGDVQLTGLPRQVYLVAAFDEQGSYDGVSGPPPPGTPVHIHGEMGVASAVATGGADTVVTVAFDDSTRMP